MAFRATKIATRSRLSIAGLESKGPHRGPAPTSPFAKAAVG